MLDKNVSALSAYNWIVATDIVNNLIPVGNYRVRICPAGSQTNCDSSDNYFTIVGQRGKIVSYNQQFSLTQGEEVILANRNDVRVKLADPYFTSCLVPGCEPTATVEVKWQTNGEVKTKILAIRLGQFVVVSDLNFGLAIFFRNHSYPPTTGYFELVLPPSSPI